MILFSGVLLTILGSPNFFLTSSSLIEITAFSRTGLPFLADLDELQENKNGMHSNNTHALKQAGFLHVFHNFCGNVVNKQQDIDIKSS
jgi:uncharacterized NAD(P)/FAD-binding protein YdhS